MTKHGVIGAKGPMGNALMDLFPGAVGVDKGSDLSAVWACNAIWLAIPRDEVDKVLDDVRLQPSQVVIDICSIKRGVAAVVRSSGATHLSLHPMHGPNIRHDRQKWFLIGGRNNVAGVAAEVLAFLEGLGIRLIETTEDEHDFMMGILLGMKELLTLAMDRMIAAYAEDRGRGEPTIAKLLDWASPVANAVYGAYVHSVLRSNDALREELVEGSTGVRESAIRALAALAEELKGLELEAAFRRQRARVAGEVSAARQDDISDHIDAWFEDVRAVR
ncbi:MAG TPA: prephenate dehydrogenase/arogenate dehydrogenase family protein [Thermoanaerobaculia bacterium]